MKIYIAGPIAGKENGNREAFAERAKELEALGHEPVNPWDIPPDHDTGACIGGKVYHDSEHEYGCFLRNDIVVLMWCDAITFLDGWEDSTGASTEAHVARSLGIPIFRMLAE